MGSEKVVDPNQTVTDNGGDGQIGDGGDNQGTSVTDDAVNEDKVVPLTTFKTVEEKYKAEKEAREKSEGDINELRTELNYLKGKVAPPQDPYEGRDEYDPVTIGELKQNEAQMKAEIAQAMQNQKIGESAARARGKYKDDSLTFDEALTIFKGPSFTNSERSAILNSADPGEQMHKYVKAFQESNDTSSASDLADQMTQNVNQAKTLSDTSKTASKNLNKLKELKKMTPQEIGRQLDEQVRNKGG